MFARHPLESRESDLSKTRIAEALRVSIIAELDAINTYIQFAEAIRDERLKKLFLDVAREEKTHLGEFLAALKEVDEEQAKELYEGFKEASEILGLKTVNSIDPPKNSEISTLNAIDPEGLVKEIENRTRKALEELRVFRKHISVVRVPLGVLAVPRSSSQEDLLPLIEVSEKFKISKASLDLSKATGAQLYIDEALKAAIELARKENSLIVNSLKERAKIKLVRGDWDVPGEAVKDVVNALAHLFKEGASLPFVLIVGPSTYSKLVAVHEKTGVMEIERLRALVGEVVLVPEVENEVLLVSVNPAALDLVVGADGEIEFLGPENGEYSYRIRETLALRVKDSKSIAVLEAK
ncbi:MAG: family 1 encapsulin nanocompartment shell protein [Acidilobaceae archaeon]